MTKEKNKGVLKKDAIRRIGRVERVRAFVLVYSFARIRHANLREKPADKIGRHLVGDQDDKT